MKKSYSTSDLIFIQHIAGDGYLHKIPGDNTHYVYHISFAHIWEFDYYYLIPRKIIKISKIKSKRYCAKIVKTIEADIHAGKYPIF